MTLVVDILSWSLIVVGGGFSIIGGLGLLRMPDVFTRLHAASLLDTMGMMGLLGGLIVQALSGAHWMSAVKLALVVVLILLTSPVATHALAHAALDRGTRADPVDDLTRPEETPPEGLSKKIRKSRLFAQICGKN